jgi:hypothetical protein
MTNLLLKLFVKDYKNTAEKGVREKYGTLGGSVGIICNILLAAVKLMAGVLSNSVSIIADAMNNLSDMASSVITLIGFKAASRPADKDHPFGHGRMEYMAAFIVSALILMVGFELWFQENQIVEWFGNNDFCGHSCVVYCYYVLQFLCISGVRV